MDNPPVSSHCVEVLEAHAISPPRLNESLTHELEFRGPPRRDEQRGVRVMKRARLGASATDLMRWVGT